MIAYYVNKNTQANGDHEVHKSGCQYLPDQENMHYLGNFYCCYPAVEQAKKIYPTADGCVHCLPACHIS